MPDSHANFAYGTVLTAPSPATSGVTIVLGSGQGALMPSVPFNATVWAAGAQPVSSNAEIVRVTGVSTDTLTVTRAQESSSARTVVVGDQFAATITKKTLTDVEGDVALKANLASPTFTGTPALPTGTTGVTQTAADNSTKLATTAYTDTGLALKANLASPTLTGTPAAPTAAVTTSTTQIATTAFVQAAQGSSFRMGIHTYATPTHPSAWSSVGGSPNSNDARWARIVIDETGHLRDLSILITTTGGNVKIGILDTGQSLSSATRTCVAIGTVVTPAQGSWATVDPNLAVTKGDTYDVLFSFDGTSAKAATPTSPTGAGTLPNTSFAPSSGTGTSNQKICGTIAAANVPALNGTVTDANMVAAAATMGFLWRIS